MMFGGVGAFAALNGDGGVVAWGAGMYGGDIPSNKVSALSSGVQTVLSTTRAFAALKSDGSVVAWGQAGHGGQPDETVEPLLSSGVHTLCSNDVAFSAINSDGAVIVWGYQATNTLSGILFTSASLREPVHCAI
jgi:hypothetical protein